MAQLSTAVNRIPGFFSGLARNPKIAQAARSAKRASIAVAKDLGRVRGAGIMAGSMAAGGAAGYYGGDHTASGAIKGALVGGGLGLGAVTGLSRGFRRNIGVAGSALKAGVHNEARMLAGAEGPRLGNIGRQVRSKAAGAYRNSMASIASPASAVEAPIMAAAPQAISNPGIASAYAKANAAPVFTPHTVMLNSVGMKAAARRTEPRVFDAYITKQLASLHAR